jgi:uncharacterized protein (DUF488 family)
MIAPRIYTIGHSTRSADEFLGLLKAHGITGLMDVRTVPKSRRHPHFSREALESSLPREGIVYLHSAALGGLRKPRPESINRGWRHDGFRGYADHMQSVEFSRAIDDLMAFGASRMVTVMCAEAKWWQCHRQLIADALVVRGIDVRHIMAVKKAPPHELTPFARVSGVQVTYPSLI